MSLKQDADIRPVVGPNLPRRGNAFSRWLGHAVLRLMGWRLRGQLRAKGRDLGAQRIVGIGACRTARCQGGGALRVTAYQPVALAPAEGLFHFGAGAMDDGSLLLRPAPPAGE